MPVFIELYERVATGAETRRVINALGRANYKVQLSKELKKMGDSEMWQAGAATGALRPKETAKVDLASAKGTTGRKSI